MRPSSFARCSRSSPRTRATTASSSATKSARRALLDADGLELPLGEELRDLRQVREPLRAPLLGDLLEPCLLAARERPRHDDVADARRVLEDPELGAARHLGRVLDLQPEAEVGLVRAVPEHHVVVGEAGERALRRLDARRLEGADDAGLHHVQHVLALDERHLEVELPELELAVGAKILVPPARCDLVVPVHPADHAELLEQLRRLGEGVELPGLQPHRREEVARALGRAAGHARRPDVDEAALVHDAANRRDRGVVEPEVPLHPVGPHVEPAVAEAQGLVDVLLVELERERRRARQDPQLLDLELDLAGRQVRVDELRRARHDRAGRLEHELVAYLVGGLGRGGRVLRVDDELDLAGVVAEVDEDEPAVVAARVGPAGDRHAAAGVVGPQLAAHDVAPGH